MIHIEVRNGSPKHEGQTKRLQETEWTARHTNTALVEVYPSPDDPSEYKKTAHYQAWREAVADMMAEPRSSVRYTNVFPDDEGWG